MRIRVPGMHGSEKDHKPAHTSSDVQVVGAVHVAHCFETLTAHFAGLPPPRPAFPDTTCPLFVTWNKAPPRTSAGLRVARRSSGWRLRGCIGTLAARPLASALGEYAVTAALRDRRFPPLTPGELPALRCTVSLLHSFERADGWRDWQVGVHGLIINFADPATGQPRTATFLPEVAPAEGWTLLQTIDALIRKAGIEGAAPAALRDSLQVTRYQSTAHSLTYDEFMAAAAVADGAAVDAIEPLQPGSPLVGAVPA